MKAGFLAAVIVGKPGTVTREFGGCKYVIIDTANVVHRYFVHRLSFMQTANHRLAERMKTVDVLRSWASWIDDSRYPTGQVADRSFI
jgi:hypothetical protein